MLYLAENVRGRTTNPVHGDYEASDALAQMLYGTDRVIFDDDYSFASVKPRAESRAGTAEHSEDCRCVDASGVSRADASDADEIFPEQKLEEVVSHRNADSWRARHHVAAGVRDAASR